MWFLTEIDGSPALIVATVHRLIFWVRDISPWGKGVCVKQHIGVMLADAVGRLWYR